MLRTKAPRRKRRKLICALCVLCVFVRNKKSLFYIFNDVKSSVAENLKTVRQRIAMAARRSGRSENDVQLIAVTKYAAPGDEFMTSLLQADCRDFGEARPQSLLEKAETFPGNENIRWHLIGPLQRNKIRRVLPYCYMIHSVDSLRLIEAIARIAEEENLPEVPPLLLEVNISSEDSKHGFEPRELPNAFDQIEKYPKIKIRGLMGMSGLRSDDGQRRNEFRKLFRLRESLGSQAPENIELKELSMGMSDDFEIAIEEGATLVRLGSILY